MTKLSTRLEEKKLLTASYTAYEGIIYGLKVDCYKLNIHSKSAIKSVKASKSAKDMKLDNKKPSKNPKKSEEKK